MEADLWGPLTSETWGTAGCVTDRPATEADVLCGKAVFYIEPADGFEPRAFPCDLPMCALLHEDGGLNAEPVVVVQAEYDVRGGIVLGYRFLGGGNGVCVLEELELVPEPTAEFFRRVEGA